MYPPMRNDSDIKFNNDFGTSSTPNFKVNDPWAVPPSTSNSVYDTSNKDKINHNNFASLNVNTSNDVTNENKSNLSNNKSNNDMSINSALLTSGTTNTSQSSIKSPINYMDNSQTLIPPTSYLNSSEDSEVITVRISPEKSGVVFKHVNYLIHSKVIIFYLKNEENFLLIIILIGKVYLNC